jgi:hypothetical protein
MIRTLLAAAAALVLATPSWAVNCALKPGVTAEAAAAGLCGYKAGARTFQGSPAEQAACLTRAVARGGVIGRPTITKFLRTRVGTVAVPGPAGLAAYLSRLSVDPAAALGGDPAVPVTADYFIIHDTSEPNCAQSGWSATLCPHAGKLPKARDTPAWAAELGYLGHPKPAPDRLAHAWTNRVGGSITEVPFDQPLRSTKFESCLDTAAKAGLFLAVENTQPRVPDPKGPAGNDFLAPRPGFTRAQYGRLALLYVMASIRRGHWLIPAFHAVLDARFLEGHDDPQHFDMRAFSRAVRGHLARIASQSGAPATAAPRSALR